MAMVDYWRVLDATLYFPLTSLGFRSLKCPRDCEDFELPRPTASFPNKPPCSLRKGVGDAIHAEGSVTLTMNPTS